MKIGCRTKVQTLLRVISGEYFVMRRYFGFGQNRPREDWENWWLRFIFMSSTQCWKHTCLKLCKAHVLWHNKKLTAEDVFFMFVYACICNECPPLILFHKWPHSTFPLTMAELSPKMPYVPKLNLNFSSEDQSGPDFSVAQTDRSTHSTSTVSWGTDSSDFTRNSKAVTQNANNNPPWATHLPLVSFEDLQITCNCHFIQNRSKETDHVPDRQIPNSVYEEQKTRDF